MTDSGDAAVISPDEPDVIEATDEATDEADDGPDETC